MKLVRTNTVTVPYSSFRLSPLQGISVTHSIFISANSIASKQRSGVLSFITAINFMGKVRTDDFNAVYFDKYYPIATCNSQNVAVTGYLINGTLQENLKESLLTIRHVSGTALGFVDRSELELFLNRKFRFADARDPPEPGLEDFEYRKLVRVLNHHHRNLIMAIKQDNESLFI